jgi:cobalt-zinc-cadmium efflux system membrane fusion protein
MTLLSKAILTNLLLLALAACTDSAQETTADALDEQALEQEVRGPNNGRLLSDGDFRLELAIFETGVPPQYRAWASQDGTSLAPSSVDLSITLTRLGARDEISFTAQGEFLRSDAVIYEPHSFSVSVSAQHEGRRHAWQFDSIEGRTRIAPAVASSLGIETAIVGPQRIEKTVQVYGRVTANTERLSHVSARFDGRIKEVFAKIGERVNAGAILATIESNQSLTDYALTAPIAGVILTRAAGPGEQSAGRELFTIMDDSTVWVDLALFPQQRAQVSQGAHVQILSAFDDEAVPGQIDRFLPEINPNQSTTARVTLPNQNGLLQPGTWVEAHIAVSERAVPLAVRRSALQSFRDFTVVFAQFGDQYEVRMLELGETSDEWVEVLGGISAGTPYVTENSFIIKADIEKAGATHDH